MSNTVASVRDCFPLVLVLSFESTNKSLAQVHASLEIRSTFPCLTLDNTPTMFCSICHHVDIDMNVHRSVFVSLQLEGQGKAAKAPHYYHVQRSKDVFFKNALHISTCTGRNDVISVTLTGGDTLK